MIITARTIPPASTEYPVENSTKCGAICTDMKGTIVRVPQSPYITGGIPESRSTTGSKNLFTPVEAYE
jgi:hypothetical protein